jgi:hypothetical protein
MGQKKFRTWIKFIKDTKDNKIGDKKCLLSDTAKKLIDAGVAEATHEKVDLSKSKEIKELQENVDLLHNSNDEAKARFEKINDAKSKEIKELQEKVDLLRKHVDKLISLLPETKSKEFNK